MAEEEILELDEILEKILFYCLEEAKGKLDVGDECVPFTVVVEGEQMFVENHPGEDVESCRANALHTVKSSSSFATHYAFCYDGFLMTDEGQMDAIVVECATREMDEAHVIALLYREQGEDVIYEQQPVYIDSIGTFFDAETVRHTIEQEEREKAEQAEFEQSGE